MGIIFMDSFEEYNDADEMELIYNPSQTTNNPSSSYARTGSQSCHSTSAGRQAYRVDTLNANELYVGAAFYLTDLVYGGGSADSGDTLLSLGDHLSYTYSSTDCSVWYDQGGCLYIDGQSNVGGPSSPILSAGNWFYLEVYVYKHGTAGEIICRLNGSVILSASGVDTYYTGSAYFGFVGWCLDFAYVDDFYIADDGFYGPLKVHTFTPDADGTYTDFTRNTGSNDYEAVDETLIDSDTTYVEGDTQGQKSSFGITASGVTGPVNSVEVRHWIKGVGDGPTKITPFVRSNSTDYSGDEFGPLAGGYVCCRTLYGADPDDSNPWTTTKLDNAEFGIEITSLSTTTTTV